MAGARRRMVQILLIVATITTAIYAQRLLVRWTHRLNGDAVLGMVDLDSPEFKPFVTQRDGLVPLHRPLGPPLPGDWLTAHPESGQTFAEFLSNQLEPPNPARCRLYVVPLGDLTATHTRIVERTKEYLAACFGVTVETLPVIPADAIPPEGRRLWDEQTGEEQWLTRYILYDVLAPRRPEDAIAVLGLTATDLFPAPGWNYVFGEASFTARVGVWSLARNGDPEESDASYRLCLRRTIKTALHETGHMLGISHCTAYECGMNGSNHREESDRHPLEFCPECQAKVWWSCRVNPVARCQQLSRLADADGFTSDAAMWMQEADVLSR